MCKAVKALKQANKLKDDTPETERVKIARKPRAEYPIEARNNKTGGIVRLAVEFGADGKIKSVVPFQKVFAGLTESSTAAAQGIVFTPAMKDGKPVSYVAILYEEEKGRRGEGEKGRFIFR